MRICNVTINNISSLAGSWFINFEQPEYIDAGIFAIVGPTGAGKTAILDAICLALYGQTPRLKQISKSGNELMNTLSGTCSAEVEYEAGGRRYRVKFSQSRAGKKSSGNLQLPRREFVDWQTGVIYEKITDVQAQVDSTTGMVYAQFTRAVLLAQGQFSAFFKANPADRAALLEQMTGTEIYSEISKRVYERCKAEKELFVRKSSGLEEINLLSEAERQALQEQLASSNSTRHSITAEMDANKDAVQWRDGLEKLAQDLAAQQLLCQEHQHNLQNFEPQEQRLDKARRAKDISDEYAELSFVRQALAEHNAELDVLQPEQRSGLKRVDELQAKLAAQKTLKQQIEGQIAELSPILDKVRQLNSDYEQVLSNLQIQQESCQAVVSHQAEQQSQLSKYETELQSYREEVASVEQYRRNNAGDKGLVEQFGVIQDRVNKLLEYSRSCQECIADVDRYKKLVTDAQLSCDAAKSSLEQITQKRLQAQQAYDQATEVLESLRPDRSDELLQAVEDERQSSLSALKDKWQSLREKRQAVVDMRAQREVLLNNGKDCREQQQQHELQLNTAKKQLQALQTLHNRQLDAQSLCDGQPCPLCGSLEHPYAHVATEADASRQVDMERLEGDISNLERQAKDDAGRLSAIELDLRYNQQNTDRFDQERQNLESTIAQAEEELNAGNTEDSIDELIERARVAKQEARQQLRIISEQQTKVETVRRELDSLNVQWAAANDQHTQSSAALAACRLQSQTCQHDYDKCQQACAEAQEKVAELFSKYDCSFSSVENITEALNSLEQRRQKWLDKSERRDYLQSKIIEITQAIEHTKADLQRQSQQAEELSHKVAVLETRLVNLREQRQQLFPDGDPLAIDNQLRGKLETLKEEVQKTDEALTSQKVELARIESRVDGLTSSIAEKKAKQETSLQVFTERLEASGFTDETEFCAARLEPDEMQRISQELERLRQAVSDSKTRFALSQEQLRQQEALKLTDLTISQLQQQAQELNDQAKHCDEELISLRTRLSEDENYAHQYQTLRAQLEQLRPELEVWQTLSDLIGSADGKKYRKFVQGLTFRTLVALANHQLRKMSPRYTLYVATGASDDALSLSVVDSYLDDSMRSADNLSGGEGFIVSLALAIGLSRLASNRNHIDSMFLDEGFGTLDEHALDQALGVLASLREDNTLIGLISHVSAVKERIGLQITVTPSSNGRSLISGPGCEHTGNRY